MRVDFLDAARLELEEAVVFYNLRREGLGFEFADEIKRTIQRIAENPEAWALLSPHTRRCRTERFPYGVIYQIRDDMLLIVAVMHLRRKPQSWRARLSGGKT